MAHIPKDIKEANEIIVTIRAENEKELQNKKMKAAISLVNRIFDVKTPTFVFELIQNAFDSGASRIKFVLTDEHFQCFHDGKQFTKEDCEAISWVNLSTKSSDKVGFMGIGFKSVFEVSKEPQIHSNPFHFSFDIREDENGKFLPNTIDFKKISDNYSTLMHLPISDSAIINMIKKELQRGADDEIEGISPKTFLHLVIEEKKKLKGISEVCINEEVFQINVNTRIPRVYNISFLRGQSWKLTERWLKFETVFSPSVDELTSYYEGKRIPKERRSEEGWKEQVSIIIPLWYGGKRKGLLDEYKGKINVYLPTAIYIDYPFDLQANFVVSADRKQLNDIDGKWNRALFKRLPQLVIDVLTWSKKYSDKSKVDRYELFKIVPDWNEFEGLSDELKEEMAELFHKGLDTKKVIPTLSKRKKYALPSKTVIVDQEIIDLFPNLQKLEKILGKNVADPGLIPVREKLCKYTEIEEWTPSDIFRIVKHEHWPELIPRHSSKISFNRWLITLYKYIGKTVPDGYWHERERKEIIKKIKKLPIFPISWDDKKKCYNLQPAYKKDGKKLYRLPRELEKISSSQLLDVFSDKITIVDKSFVNYMMRRTAKKLDKEQLDTLREVQSFFEDHLGIKELGSKTIITDFLLPAIQKPEEIDKDTLIKYSSFIGKGIKSIMKKIPKELVILNGNSDYVSSTSLYLNRAYHNQELEEFFGTENKEMYVSDEYLSKGNLTADEWVIFFESIGVNKLLTLDLSEEKYHRNELKKIMDLEDLYHPRASDYYDIPAYKYLVVNPHFKKEILERLDIIQSYPKIVRNRMINAFWDIIDSNWDDYYSKYKEITGRFVRERGSTVLRIEDEIYTPDSPFVDYIKETPLIVTENSDELQIADRVLRYTDENWLLSSQGVLVSTNIIRNDELAELLNFKKTVSDVSPIEHLRSIKANGKMTQSIFKDKAIEIMSAIEEKTLTVKEVREAFEREKLILDNKGEYRYQSEVIFNSSFSIYYVNYEKQYPELKEFFCEILGCPEKEPTIEQVLNLFIEYLWKEKGNYRLDDRVRADIIKCYRRINNYLSERNEVEKLPQLFTDFQENCLVYCLNKGWLSPNENVIVHCDITKFRDSISKSKTASIASHIEHMKQTVDTINPLLEFLNVIPASQLISNVNPINSEPYLEDFDNTPGTLILDNLTDYCDALIKILQHFNKEEKEVPKQLIEKMIEKIKEFSSSNKNLLLVEKIDLTLLTHTEMVVVLHTKEVYIQKKGRVVEIYLTAPMKFIHDLVSDEILDYLGISQLPAHIFDAIRTFSNGTTSHLSSPIFKEAVEMRMKKYSTEIEISEEPNIDATTDEDEEIDVILPESEENEEDEELEDIEEDEDTLYEDIVEPVDIENVTIITPELEDTVPSPIRKSSKRRGKGTGKRNVKNPHSDEDGKRGEKIVFDKESERVKKIVSELGLNIEDYKVDWISERIIDNQWDIESWDYNKKKDGLKPIRIEVKSTTGSSLTFPMPKSEFREAMKISHKKGRVFLYRVFNVRTENPRIKRYDFAKFFKKGLIRIEGKDFSITLPEER